MKNYRLVYNEYGYLAESIQTDEYYIAQLENDSVSISATFPGKLVGSVKAYVEFPGGGDIIECEKLAVNNHTATATLSSDHLRYHYLLVGFEVDTGTKQIRFEPVTLEVDKFVNPTGSASPSAYTVTIKIGNVTELEPGQPPFVNNSGTDKHVILDFGIPKGADGYTPVKGVDYFTEEDIEGLGIDDKVDKVDGKGLSTNDFTDELKNKLDGIEPNATALPKVINIYCENQLDERIAKWKNKSLFNEYTDDGLYYFSLKYNNYGDINDEYTYFSQEAQDALLLVNNGENGGDVVNQTLIIDGRIYITTFWSGDDIIEWQEIYASKYDLDKAIGDVETSLENIIAKYGLGGDGV